MTCPALGRHPAACAKLCAGPAPGLVAVIPWATLCTLSGCRPPAMLHPARMLREAESRPTCSRLSSVEVVLWTAFFFLHGSMALTLHALLDHAMLLGADGMAFSQQHFAANRRACCLPIVTVVECSLLRLMSPRKVPARRLCRFASPLPTG